nr:hypothetical protein CFP56_31960 [Quercus suber]
MFRILGAVEDLNRHLGLGLTWLDVVYMYECHSQQGAGYYLKFRSDIIRLVSCLPKSNKGMKDDYVIVSGAWHDGHHCPTTLGEPDRDQITLRLSLTNAAALNYLLRSEIFVSEDGQHRSVPLILGYTAKPKDYQPIGNAITQGDYRLNRIDVARKGFLAPYGLAPVPHPNLQGVLSLVQPIQQIPLEPAVVDERVSSSTSSLKEQIDKFEFGGEALGGERVIELSNAKEEADRQSSIHPVLITALPEDSSDEDMVDLKTLMKNRGKKAETKGTGTSQLAANLPLPPPQILLDLGIKQVPDPKKKRPIVDTEEREMAPPRGTK